ncbi:hypothetical protein [Jeongeupia naejangsanensis]|uniref:Activation-induced cytidine deaminase AID domain-containing protein n=1 Tax=Jeongeupia naejangsanensis TaxID=613195 RepID=A0ABS2BJ16_9NEIS|nr:hypothetical protein [Jeongeupia naejangsanensis]MBM3114981.1 hypothetical protein [Jeongeupia naejangsanensis]
MTSLVNSLRNIRSPAQRLNRQEVWCLLRFDQLDSTIETFWSESKVTSFINVPKNRSKMEMGALSAQGVPAGYKATKNKVEGLPGRHAEQVLCNNFARLLADYKKTPQIVEIFLSDSPCLNASNAENGFPQGCAHKFLQLANSYTTIPSWRIYYEQVYAGNNDREVPNSQQSINLLSGHARIVIGMIDPTLLT